MKLPSLSCEFLIYPFPLVLQYGINHLVTIDEVAGVRKIFLPMVPTMVRLSHFTEQRVFVGPCPF